MSEGSHAGYRKARTLHERRHDPDGPDGEQLAQAEHVPSGEARAHDLQATYHSLLALGHHL